MHFSNVSVRICHLCILMEKQFSSTQRNMMLIPRRSLLIAFTFLFITLIPAQADEDNTHTSFIFDGFNGTQLILEEEASIIRSKSVLVLTNQSQYMLGRALYSVPVQMKANGTLSSFSTTFVFSMVKPPSAEAGQGFAFIIMPHRIPIGATAEQYLGLLNLTSNGQPYNHLFAVEFDTIKTAEFYDPDDNHVGVNINSLISMETKPAGYWTGEESLHGLNLKSGRNIQAWIDYNHSQSRLNVTIMLAGSPRPQKPLISLKINLSNVLQEKMFVGFTATTGIFMENHYVLAWSFNTQGMAPPLNLSRLPSFANMYTKPRGWGFIAGITMATVLFPLVVAAVFFIKRKYGKRIVDWEMEYWPHRLSYKELSIATSKFREENVLGEGGFGKVYKGVLPSSGKEVAVKCINKEVTEGMKGFISEISSMGRLEHRNLVHLRGWCRTHRQVFIVYDYMSNGSLDKFIYGNPTTVLPWHRRYVILKGVAAGLLYLHDQWEKRVIHRDIKSSNVLLVSELNGRLGDFGLARLYDHNGNPQTTHVVGTLGYIAPELLQTGKAMPSSDVFSFGVLLLEVTCGRSPVDALKGAEQMILVEWVWALYTERRLLEALDPKLDKDRYDACQMEKVLKLGLLCSHPEPERRPVMRHVCQILEGEAPLPDIRRPSFNVTKVGCYPRGLFKYSSDKFWGSTSRGSLSEEKVISTSDDAQSLKQGHINRFDHLEAFAGLTGSTSNTEDSSAAPADLVKPVMGMEGC